MKLIYIFLFLFLFNYLNISCQRIYINSIPKCGTHLLMECIKKLTNRTIINTQKDAVTNNELPKLDDNSVVCWHVKYSNHAEHILRKNNFRGVFIYRDPRDQAVSAAFWCIKIPGLLEKNGFDKNDFDFNELLTRMIKRVNNEYDSFLLWTKNDLFYSLKFEDLVGPKGGGNLTSQKQVLTEICFYLRINPTEYLLNYCINNMFGNTVTFRQGKIGSWKKYFTKQHKKLFKEFAGQLLIDLGYEKNFNW